jgi:gliding motility-associated-like protein
MLSRKEKKETSTYSQLKVNFIGPLLLCLFISKFGNTQVNEYNMYSGLLQECDGILYDSGGPDGIYGVNENIVFTIQSPGILDISFFGEFCLEANFDILSIYDGPNTSSPLLGSFSGTSLPSDLVATSGFITFQLISDQSASYCGFSLEWNSTVPPPIPPTLGTDPLPQCGENILPVYFSSPLECDWLDGASFEITSSSGITVEDVNPICNGGISNSADLVLSSPFEYNCSYDLTLEIGIPDACDSIHNFIINHSFIYDNCPISAEIQSDFPSVCLGGDVLVWVEVDGCLTYTYSWNNGLPSTAGPHLVSPTSTTTYTVTITEVETGIQTIESITIDVEDIEITTPPQDWCLTGGILVLEANGPGFWFGQGITNTIAGTFDPTIGLEGINVLYHVSNACVDSVAIEVIPIFAGGTVAACPGSDPFQLPGFPAGGNWFGPFTTFDGIFTPGIEGSYPIIYTFEDCVDVLIVNVDNIESTSIQDTVCASEADFQIDFSPLGGVWSGPGILDTLNGIFSPETVGSGDAYLEYAINGCSQTFEYYVKEIEIGGNYHSACPDEAPLVWYDGNPSPPGGVWSGDGIIDTSTGFFDPGLFTNGSSTSIIYDAPNGCSDTMYIDILSTYIETSNLEFCLTEEPFLLNDQTVNNGPGQNGTWLGSGIIIGADFNWYFDPAVAGAGSHIIYYEKNNCLDSIAVEVYNPNLSVSDIDACQSDNPFIIDPSVENTGTWTGPGIINASTGTFFGGLSGPGDFVVYWEILPSCGDSVNISVEAFEAANIIGIDPSYCFSNQEVSITLTPTGGIQGGSLSTTTFNPSVLGSGNYYVTYTLIGASCTSTDSVSFIVHPPLSISLEFSEDTVCTGQATNLLATSNGGIPDSTIVFIWSNTDITEGYQTYVPEESTTVYVTANDNCSESVIDSVQIIVLPTVQMSAFTSDTSCFGFTGFITADAIGDGEYSFLWDGASESNPTLNAPAGTAHSLEVVDIIYGCSNDTTIIIPAYTPVQASYSINPNLACIPFDQATNVSFIDFSSFAQSGIWDFGNGISEPYMFGENMSTSYSESGYYEVSLIVYNEGGCSDTLKTEVCVLADTPIFLPDIFSPNSDGNNDVLFVRSQGIISMEFSLFNAWGEKVFSSGSVDKGWDGYYRGLPSPEGIYVYTLVANLNDGNAVKFNGEITLVR